MCLLVWPPSSESNSVCTLCTTEMPMYLCCAEKSNVFANSYDLDLPREGCFWKLKMSPKYSSLLSVPVTRHSSSSGRKIGYKLRKCVKSGLSFEDVPFV